LKNSGLKAGNSVDGLASFFSNFEIALNRSFEIAQTFEDSEVRI
jgi:hypothetical protein